MSHVRGGRAATTYSGGTTTTTSSVKGYSSTLRKSRILIFSLLYHVQHQLLPFIPLLRNVVLFLEMLQIISLALEPAFTDFGNSHINDGLSYFGRIRMPMPALASSGAHTAALTILIIYLGLVLVSGIKLALMEDGTVPPPPYLLRGWGLVAVSLHQILYLPALSILFSAMHCGIVYYTGGDPLNSLSGLRDTYSRPTTVVRNTTFNSGGFEYSLDYVSSDNSASNFYNNVVCEEGQSISYLILTCVFLCITICYFGVLAFSEYGFEQHRKDPRNFFAHTLSRLSFVLFLLKTCATLYVQFSGRITLETRAALYQWVIMACFISLAYYIFKYIPYYYRAANMLYLSLFSLCFLGALMGFISTRTTDTLPTFITFMVLIVPIIMLSVFAVHMRVRKFFSQRKHEDINKIQEFRGPFEVEIVARTAIYDGLSNDSIRSTYWRGLKHFPESPGVQLAFMQYLIEDSDNFQMLTSTVEKVKKLKSKMPMDMKFLLHCIEKQRMSVALSMDGGIEEVSKILLNANHHAHRAKLLVKNFWESLLHEEDLLLMPNMVAKLEHEETAADRAFQKLRARFPRNVAVMRHYAQFLDEVKGDPDSSQELFKLAEEIEQETSTSHLGREKHGMIDSVGTATGKIIEEIVVLEDARTGNVRKDKEKASGDSYFEPHSHDTIKPRHRIKKLLLDSGSGFGADYNTMSEDSPRKSPFVTSPRAYSPTPPNFEQSQTEARSIPHVSSSRKNKHDLMRYRQYREQADVFRSHSVWKISSAINLTLLILLLNMVILFAATMAVLNAHSQSINQLADMVDTRQNVALCISSTLRALRFTATNDSDSFQTDVSTMQAAISYLANNTMKMYEHSESYGPVKRGWSVETYPTYFWNAILQSQTGDGYIVQQTTTLDMITEFTFWMEQAYVFIAKPNGVDSLWNSSSGRFTLDNGLDSVTKGVSHLVDLYENKGRYTVSILQKITITLLPLSFVLVIGLLWFLVRSAIREIQHERVTILKLFLAIPKDNILTIVSSYKAERSDEHEDEDLFAANEDEVSNFDSTVDLAEGDHQLATTIWMAKNSRLSMLRNFFFKFLLSLLSGFFLVVIASAIILAAVPDFNANIRSINLAGQRRTIVSHLHSTAMTLAYYAETSRSYPTFNASTVWLAPDVLRNMITDDITKIQTTDADLKFGRDGASSIQGHPDLINLAYNTDCTALPGYTYTCSGMNSLLVYIIALAEIVDVIPDSQLSFLTSQLATLSDIAYKQLNTYLGQAVQFYIDIATSRVDDVRTSIIAIFVVIFPVLIIVNFILRPMVRKVKQEHKRTLRMLLMIPMNVIDTTPSIKEYLDSLTRKRSRPPWYKFGMLRWGKGIRKSNKTEQLMQSHEPILHAFSREADEALMVASGEGTIEMVSLSTERILGYERRQLLGHRLASVFDEKSNEFILSHFQQLKHHEGPVIRESTFDLHAKHANGEYIPVGITISSLKINSKSYFGLYVRNISYLRTIETQMEKERAIVSAEQTKLKELLLNVFPKSIAEQLLIKGEGSYQPQLIAEEYKEATVLFADIVGFTTMCSDLEPGALLLILDGIFTQWDALVEKYKLQKIKTIGDCFMAAGGVPDRTVDHAERIIDFAMEMAATLQRYNETCQILKSRSLTLNIRIGINTGPVVAGIIGRSRMCFDLWGDAVNVASRMESTSVVGRIQVSQATFNRVKNNYQFEERGSIEVKGKGAMLTYLLVAPRFLRTDSGKVIDSRFAAHLYTPTVKVAGTNTNASSSSPDTNNNNTPNNTNPNVASNTSATSPINSPGTPLSPSPQLLPSGSTGLIPPPQPPVNRNNRRSSISTTNTSAFTTFNTNRRGSTTPSRPNFDLNNNNNNTNNTTNNNNDSYSYNNSPISTFNPANPTHPPQ